MPLTLPNDLGGGGGGAVSSVNGHTGTVALVPADLGLGTAALLNVPAVGNASSGQVVKGNDSRLGGGGGSGQVLLASSVWGDPAFVADTSFVATSDWTDIAGGFGFVVVVPDLTRLVASLCMLVEIGADTELSLRLFNLDFTVAVPGSTIVLAKGVTADENVVVRQTPRVYLYKSGSGGSTFGVDETVACSWQAALTAGAGDGKIHYGGHYGGITQEVWTAPG